jgi:hypothetical protein
MPVSWSFSGQSLRDAPYGGARERLGGGAHLGVRLSLSLHGEPEQLDGPLTGGVRERAVRANDGEGDGRGHTFGFVIRGNYCVPLEASQALMFEDVQRVTVVGNTFAAGTDHAIGLAIHSTGARVHGSRTDPRVRYEVGIDASSRPGYRGPKPGGTP